MLERRHTTIQHPMRKARLAGQGHDFPKSAVTQTAALALSTPTIPGRNDPVHPSSHRSTSASSCSIHSSSSVSTTETPPSQTMAARTVIPVHSGWAFKAADEDDSHWLPVAQFPTNIHLDLLAHQKIPDPFIGKNESLVQWVGERKWMYRTRLFCRKRHARPENRALFRRPRHFCHRRSERENHPRKRQYVSAAPRRRVGCCGP